MPGKSRQKTRSPSPLSDAEPDIYASKVSKKTKSKSKSKSKSTSRRKQDHGSHRQASSDNKKETIPNEHDLEDVDTSELKVLLHPIHLHLRILMRREKATSLVPPPPTTSEKNALETRYVDSEFPDNLAPYLLPPNPLIRISNRVSDTFYDTLEMTLRRWGLARFTFDWDGNFDDAYNQISVQFFLKTFIIAVRTRQYGLRPLARYLDTSQLVAVLFRSFKTLRAAYKAQIDNPLILQDRYESSESRKEKEKRLTEYREFLKEGGVPREIASIFQRKNYAIMGDFEEVEIKSGGRVQKERRVYYPLWWSNKMITLMKFMETNIQLRSRLTIKKRGAKRIPINYLPSSSEDFQDVPEGLPCDLYSDEFTSVLLPAMLCRYEKKPPCLPFEMRSIFPQPENMTLYDSDDSLASLTSEDTEESQLDDGSDSDREIIKDKQDTHLDTREISNTHQITQVTSISDLDPMCEGTSRSTESNALILYSDSRLNTNPPLPSDHGPSPLNSDTTSQIEEIEVDLHIPNLDQRLSSLSMGLETEYKKKLEVEVTGMRATIENEMRAAMEEEKRQMIAALTKELAADKDRLLNEKQQFTNQINAEREELNVEKQRIIAEKDHIDAVVIAEKERITAVILAEKNMIDTAVAAERERLELERSQLQGALTQIQHYQPSSNHAYPPS